jgi:hypothetical protein
MNITGVTQRSRARLVEPGNEFESGSIGSEDRGAHEQRKDGGSDGAGGDHMISWFSAGGKMVPFRDYGNKSSRYRTKGQGRWDAESGEESAERCGEISAVHRRLRLFKLRRKSGGKQEDFEWKCFWINGWTDNVR